MAKKKPKISKKEQVKPVTENQKDYITELVNNVMSDDRARDQYLDKLQCAYEQRLMIETEDDTLPWPGAPNYKMPFTDKHIRKRKPVFISSMLNPTKMAIVEVQEGVPDPDGQFKARANRAEKALNLFLRKRINWIHELIIGTDYLLEKGRSYFKVFEEFNSKFVNRTVNIRDFTRRPEFTQMLLEIGAVNQETGQPDIEEGIQALRDLDLGEVVLLIANNTGFGFNLEDPTHKEILKSIAKRFKAGEDEIDFQMEVIESIPKISAIPAERVILPPDSPLDVQRSTRVTHEFFMSKHDLLKAVEAGQFDKKVVEDKIAQDKKDTNKRRLEVHKDMNEGISVDGRPGQFKIWEIHSYWQAPGSPREEKWVTTVFAKEHEPLRFIREPNDDDVFPFVNVDHEIRDDRAYSSRGVPEMLRNVQAVIDMQENNRMRRDIVNNNPFFTIKRQAGILSNAIQYIPGEGLVVEDHDDLRIQNFSSNVDVSSERIEQAVKQFGEEYIGSIDFAFNAGALSGVGRTSKTLGEVQLAAGEASKIANLDFIIYKDAITKVYEMVFDLLRQRIGDNIEIEGQLITKDDFNFPVDIRANGSLEESDRAFKINKAIARMQIAAQQDPSYVTVEDKYNAYLDFLESDGVEQSERLSTDPNVVMNQEIAQRQQSVQQLALQEQQLMEVLEDREQELTKVEEKTRRAKNKNTAIRQRVAERIGA